MPARTYMIEPKMPGRKGISISEIVSVGSNDRTMAVLHLIEGTPGEVAFDVVQALKRAYENGREDRSEELLGDPDKHPSYYRDVAVPDALRASWTSQAAHYWRLGVDAASKDA